MKKITQEKYVRNEKVEEMTVVQGGYMLDVTVELCFFDIFRSVGYLECFGFFPFPIKLQSRKIVFNVYFVMKAGT